MERGIGESGEAKGKKTWNTREERIKFFEWCFMLYHEYEHDHDMILFL